MTLYIASDHAGFQFKENLKKALPQIEWVDLGPTDASRVDYPDYADRLCKRLLTESASARSNASSGRGVLICGSGQGMAMRANRYRGIRAALVWNEESTRLSREHNDANVLCLGARLLDETLAAKLVQTFLETAFAGGRHQDRVDKLGLAPNC